jgi:hypothetical protein
VLRIAAAALAWAAALACVPHPASDPVCEGDPVAAKSGVLHISSAGDQPAHYVAKATVNAWLPKPGSGRGFVACQGADDGQGNLTIGAVPTGPLYYFQSNQFYFVTVQHTLDLTSVDLGHAGLVAATHATPVTLNVSNLDPWAGGDFLELFSTDGRVYGSQPETLAGASGKPSNNETSLALTFDWSQLYLPNQLTNDHLLLGQYAQRVANSQLLIKLADLSPATVVDGTASTLTGSFSAVNASNSLSIQFARGSFHGAASAVAPDAMPSLQYVSVQALPEAQNRGDYDVSLDLAAVSYTPDSTPLNATASYPTPPAPLQPFGVVDERFTVNRSVGGATAKVDADVFVNDTIDHMNGQSISPLVLPVDKPQLDGQDAFGGNLIVGETPVVSWSRPSPGPDAVEVLVEHLKPNGATATFEFAAGILTATEKEIQIPPGVLKSGESYFLIIRSQVSVGTEWDTAPFHLGMPNAYADAVTAVFVAAF